MINTNLFSILLIFRYYTLTLMSTGNAWECVWLHVCNNFFAMFVRSDEKPDLNDKVITHRGVDDPVDDPLIASLERQRKPEAAVLLAPALVGGCGHVAEEGRGVGVSI